MRVALVGRKGLGGVQMRAVDVARELGVEFLDLKEFPTKRFYDCIVLVKYWNGFAGRIRNSCSRLIYDPLDSWSSTRFKVPDRFWLWCAREVKFDEIIATSPACAHKMRIVLKKPVHILKHHCDQRITNDWYNSKGPVVYSGGNQFIKSELSKIRSACNKLGKEFVISSGRGCWKVLKGASLCLHLRLQPEDTLLNKWCKPQVKLENACAAGLPLLATKHPCIQSLIPWNIIWYEDYGDWAESIRAGLMAKPQEHPYTLEQYVSKLGNIIFGGSSGRK